MTKGFKTLDFEGDHSNGHFKTFNKRFKHFQLTDFALNFAGEDFSSHAILAPYDTIL